MACRWINVCFPFVVGVILLNGGVTSYPTGAPQEVCTTMIPNHATFSPSLDPPPFTISVSPEKFSAADPVNG